jgi:hypothetical protein
MVRSRYILENPVAAALPRPIIKRPPGLIYTPEEAAEILKATKDNDQIGFWAMSLFAGLRVDELRNIQKLPIPWSVIDFRKGVIDLRGTQTQQFARLVTIQPVLGSWLQWIKTKNVPFFPLNHWDKLRVTRATVLANRRALSGTGGSRRPAFSVPGRRVCSIARRSYISYRMALTGVSYAHVAEDSGTTENLLRTEYYRKATKEEAERYFSLTPKSLLIST